MHAFHPGDLFGHDDAFMHGLVRQPGRAHQVADGPNAIHAGLAILADHHMGLLDFDARGFQADIFDIADNAHGQDHAVDRDLFGLAGLVLQSAGDVVAALVQLGDLGADLELHALLGESLGGKGGDFLVFHRQHAVQHFHHGHVRAQGAIETGEFDADGAGTDDQQ